jgi:peptide/nickel transport system ATP-binding protein
MTEPILAMQGIEMAFGRREDWIDRAGRALRGGQPRPLVHALNGVDLTVRRGEIFGIAGESGCGKSTLGRIMVGLLKPSGGTVSFNGEPVTRGNRPRHLALQMIFQDSGSALNPRMRVRDLVGEGPLVHGRIKRRELADFVAHHLELVGLSADAMQRFPHQFSGGQRQRINIARALALGPKLLVCDESIAALDVSIQSQILNLFLDLKDRLNLTYVFISHDLGVIRHITDRVAVMYLGRIVEEGASAEVFERPRHPYTRVLLENVPHIEKRHQSFSPAKGEVPSPMAMPPGCAFHPRCAHALASCRQAIPPLLGSPGGHRHACPVVEAGLVR